MYALGECLLNVFFIKNQKFESIEGISMQVVGLSCPYLSEWPKLHRVKALVSGIEV